ncbi:alpha/beta fold hydrolase [Ruegeria hyattellae]|uniref:alpha/beta fold hydrolase n=1 Tax=Ruegeria hyattellae TaxID=3233337 RepID=UPI00355B5B9B
MTAYTSTDDFPCIDRGEGSPILFIHGAACDHRIWEPHVDHFAKRHRCIAPTLRWFGQMHWRSDSSEFGEKAHSDDLAAIIEGLGCGPVSVVGWSYGANVALRLTVDRPDLVSRVVAYEPSSTSLVCDATAIEIHHTSMRETFFPVTDAASKGDWLGVLTAFIDAVGGRGTFEKLTPDFRLICLENAHTLIPLLNSKHRFASISVGELEVLSMPVHVAWGERSGKVWTIPSESAAGLANICGHKISDADHIWPVKDPSNFLLWLDSIIGPDSTGTVGCSPTHLSGALYQEVSQITGVAKRFSWI